MGLPPLSPMVDIWGIILKGRKVAPTLPDRNYGSGVLTVIGPFGGASHHMPLKFNSESNNEVKILGWEGQLYQNTTSKLVLEAQNHTKHNEFQGFQLLFMMFQKHPTEILSRPDDSDLDSRKHVNSPLDHQI